MPHSIFVPWLVAVLQRMTRVSAGVTPLSLDDVGLTIVTGSPEGSSGPKPSSTCTLASVPGEAHRPAVHVLLVVRARVAGLAVANETGLPRWNPGDEFEAARKAALESSSD